MYRGGRAQSLPMTKRREESRSGSTMFAFVPAIGVSALPSQARVAKVQRSTIPRAPNASVYARPTTRRARIQTAAMSMRDDDATSGAEHDADGDEGDEPDDSMTVYRKSGKKLPFEGDALPFDVKVISPPPHMLGRFKLHPRTNCGDVIEHDAKSYVVKRVRCHYRLERSGSPKMFKKTIEIKSLARKSIESYLERTFRES